MRILIDTNIIIGLEDNRTIEDDFSDFYRSATSNQISVFYHSGCLRDISRDKDLKRREIILSKIKKYSKLKNPAIPSADFVGEVGQKNENDKVDNEQLFQLYCGYVDVFVTEDQGIHKRAKRLGCQEYVLTVREALNWLKREFEYKLPQHPILKHGSVRNIGERIEEPFFDSLKESYKGFDNWFGKCLKENRQCYHLTVDNKLSALLIFNIESVDQHQIPGIFNRALKICTFKTDTDGFGLKMGELFLNKMFQYCIERNIEFIYLTLFEKHKFLIGLLTRFGFKQHLERNKELVMVKPLKKENLESSKPNGILIHPFYSDSPEFSKYVIPIQPQFYDTLFKDSLLRQPTLFDQEKESLNEIQGNSIIKAYISGAKIRSLEPGNILLFYASKKLQLIQPVGVLDRFYPLVKDLKKLKSVVRGKTVFSEKQLEDMFNESSGELSVVIFRLIYYLKKPIELDTIKKLRCFANKFITITRMHEEDYLLLKKEKYFDERYIID